MRQPAPNVTASELATRYAVSRRTIQRWKVQGVDVQSPDAVALHIVKNPRVKIPVLVAVQAAIESQKTPQL